MHARNRCPGCSSWPGCGPRSTGRRGVTTRIARQTLASGICARMRKPRRMWPPCKLAESHTEKPGGYRKHADALTTKQATLGSQPQAIGPGERNDENRGPTSRHVEHRHGAHNVVVDVVDADPPARNNGVAGITRSCFSARLPVVGRHAAVALYCRRDCSIARALPARFGGWGFSGCAGVRDCDA